MREKSSLKTLSVFCRVFLCVAHSPLSGSGTFLSTDQLSHHSHFPPPRPPPPLWMILCLTLSPSPFVLFHWPCMFQKQISFSSMVQPPSPSLPPTLLHYLLTKSKALCPVLVQAHHLTSQLHHLEPHPCPPIMSSRAGNWRRVSPGVSTNPGAFGGIKLWACVRLFALSVSPALLNWRVPHFKVRVVDQG